MDLLTLLFLNSMSRLGLFKTSRYFFAASARRQITEELIEIVVRKAILTKRLAQLNDPEQKVAIANEALALHEKQQLLYRDLLLTL